MAFFLKKAFYTRPFFLLLFLPMMTMVFSTKDFEGYCSTSFSNEFVGFVACTIDSMKISMNPCNDNGTQPDWTDDFFLANFTIFYEGANLGDVIEVEHSSLLEPSTAVISQSDLDRTPPPLTFGQTKCRH